MVSCLLGWKSETLTGWCLVDWLAQDWETQLGNNSLHYCKYRHLHTSSQSPRTRYSSCKRDSNRRLHLPARSRRRTQRLHFRKLDLRYSERSRGLRLPRRHSGGCKLVYWNSRHSGRLRTFRKSSRLCKIALRCIVMCMYDWVGNTGCASRIPVPVGS